MMTDTIRTFLDACQPFGYPLLACSVLLIAAILYHLIFTGRGWESTLQLLQEHAAAERFAPRTDALSRVAYFVLSAPQGADIAAATEARLRRVIDSGRAGMATIHIITNVAPMLGILGTAWGLVDIFGVFGSPEAQAGIAVGISKALYTTIFGLAIAVPGIIAQTCCERRLERRAARINVAFTDLLSHR